MQHVGFSLHCLYKMTTGSSKKNWLQTWVRDCVLEYSDNYNTHSLQPCTMFCSPLLILYLQKYRVTQQVSDLCWVDLDSDVLLILPILPISPQQRQNHADIGTAKIKVNPTQVQDLLCHPVHATNVHPVSALTPPFHSAQNWSCPPRATPPPPCTRRPRATAATPSARSPPRWTSSSTTAPPQGRCLNDVCKSIWDFF